MTRSARMASGPDKAGLSGTASFARQPNQPSQPSAGSLLEAAFWGRVRSAKIVIDARLRRPDVPDDYAVDFEGHSIGRVRLEATSWLWSISIPMGVPDWAEGTASTRDDGFKALAAAWGRL